MNSDKFWMVYVEDYMSCGAAYEIEEDAEEEAERLAVIPKNTGRKVYVLETKAYCVVGMLPVTWKRKGNKKL